MRLAVLSKLFDPRTQQAVLFAACCLFVAVVSVHDAVLVVVNHEMIGLFEQNPMGRLLLELQGEDVWLFVLVKLAGTAVVCATLITLYQHHQRIAVATAVGLAVVHHIGMIQCAAMAPSGEAVALGCEDGSIYLCSVAAGVEPNLSREVRCLRLLHRSPQGAVMKVIFSPNGKRVAAVGGHSLCLLSCPAGNVLQTCPLDNEDSRSLLAFSGDSERLLSYGGGEAAQLWCAATGKQVATILLTRRGLEGVALSPDAQFAILVYHDGLVRVWSFAGGKTIGHNSLTRFTSTRIPPVISPSGVFVATMSDSITVQLNNVSTGAVFSQLRGHERHVNGFAFGTDHQLYTWDAGGSIRVWNLDAQGEQVRHSSLRRSERGLVQERAL